MREVGIQLASVQNYLLLESYYIRTSINVVYVH